MDQVRVYSAKNFYSQTLVYEKDINKEMHCPFVSKEDTVTGIRFLGVAENPEPTSSFFCVVRMLKRALWSATPDTIH